MVDSGIGKEVVDDGTTARTAVAKARGHASEHHRSWSSTVRLHDYERTHTVKEAPTTHAIGHSDLMCHTNKAHNQEEQKKTIRF